MDMSETSGLASYQQTVYHTPGLASSVGPQGTSVQVPVVIHIVPIEYGKQEKEDLKTKTV